MELVSLDQPTIEEAENVANQVKRVAAMESLELINDIAEESRPRRVSSLFMVRSASRARMVGCAMFAAAGFLVFATVLIATRPRGAVADICKTKSCGTLAAELVKTMNTSADPCTVRTRYEQLRPHNSSSCSQCSCIAMGGRGFPYCAGVVVAVLWSEPKRKGLL